MTGYCIYGVVPHAATCAATDPHCNTSGVANRGTTALADLENSPASMYVSHNGASGPFASSKGPSGGRYKIERIGSTVYIYDGADRLMNSAVSGAFDSQGTEDMDFFLGGQMNDCTFSGIRWTSEATLAPTGVPSKAPTDAPSRAPTEHPTPVLGSSQQTPGASCMAIRDAGATGDGVFWVSNPGGGDPVRVYCDHSTGGGGWTLCAQQSGTQTGAQLWHTGTLALPSGGGATSWSACGRFHTSSDKAEVLFKVFAHHNDAEDAPFGALSVTWPVALANSKYPAEFTVKCHKCDHDDGAFKARAEGDVATNRHVMYVEHVAFDGLGLTWDKSAKPWHTGPYYDGVMVGSPYFGCAEHWTTPSVYHRTYHAFSLYDKTGTECNPVVFKGGGLSSSNSDGKTSVYVRDVPPTNAPTKTPTDAPSKAPTDSPSAPTRAPTDHPTPVFVLIATASSHVLINKDWWSSRCSAVGNPMLTTTSTVRVDMGVVKDYFRPTSAMRLCDMMTAHVN